MSRSTSGVIADVYESFQVFHSVWASQREHPMPCFSQLVVMMPYLDMDHSRMPDVRPYNRLHAVFY